MTQHNARALRFALVFLTGLLAAGVSAPAAAQDVHVLLVAVDGNVPLPRTLRHHQNNQVVQANWNNLNKLRDYAFDGSTSFAALFDEMSYGEAQLTGDVAEVALPYDAGDWTWQQWADLADAELTSQGWDLTQYDRFLYLLPYLPKDAPAIGTAVGARGMCSQQSYIDLSCVFHELGHTLGLRHASELQPGGSVQGQGDVSDGLMGLGFNCHVNAVNKYLSGWLVGNRLHEVTSPGTSNHALAPQSAQADALQVVRIGVGELDTFVSYRDTQGFDNELVGGLLDVNGDDPANSVVIHRHASLSGGDAIYVESLQAGQTHQGFGLTVTVLSIAGGTAQVQVTRSAYQPQPPQVSINPSSVSNQAWNLGNYTLSITNTNPGSTPVDAYYDIALSAPTVGWSLGFTTFQGGGIAPGDTRNVPFWVQPPGSLPLGPQVFSLVVTDPFGDAGAVASQAFATFQVIGPTDTTPPSRPVGIDVSGSAGSAFVSWMLSTDDLSGIDHYEVARARPNSQAMVIVGTTGWFGIVDESWEPGDRYTVRAWDKAGNVSAWAKYFPATNTPGCGLGFELVVLLPLVMRLRTRRRSPGAD